MQHDLDNWVLIPPWLADALLVHREQATSGEVDPGAGLSSGSLARTVLMPALTPQELSAWVLLVSRLQSSILEDGGNSARPVVRLEDADLSRWVPKGLLGRTQSSTRILQSLPALRLLVQDGGGVRPEAALEGQQSQGVARSVRLLRGLQFFVEDRWVRGQKSSGYDLEVVLDEQGLGLLLGYEDAYGALVQQAREGVRHSWRDVVFSRDRAPLSTWRSLWLDFRPPEHRQLLTLEAAAQWGGRWLELSGTLGLPLGEYLRVVPDGWREGRGWDMVERWGRRLRDHGYLAPIQPQYLALDDRAPTWIWQLSAQRLRGQGDIQYRRAVARLYSRRWRRHEDFWRHVARLFEVQWPEVVWAELTAEESMAEDIGELAFVEGSRILVDRAMLFEFFLRARSTVHPLVEGVRSRDLGSALGATDRLQAVGDLEMWMRWLRDEHGALQVLAREDPNLTLAFGGAESGTWIRALHGLMTGQCRPPVLRGAASDGESRQPGELQAALDTESDRPRVVRPGGKASLDLGRATAGSGSLQPSGSPQHATLAKLAGQELARMKTQDVASYDALRKRYLDSLDPQARQVIQEVRARMQPSLFEQHLEQRMVRWMIDHPAEWRSARSSQQGGLGAETIRQLGP